MHNAGTIVVCNKPNVDENFVHEEVPPIVKDTAKELLREFADKIVVCDTIGRDIWCKEDHPDLLVICDEFIDRIGEKDA